MEKQQEIKDTIIACSVLSECCMKECTWDGQVYDCADCGKENIQVVLPDGSLG